MLNIDEPKLEQKVAVFNSGFRIFFLSAGLFAVFSMLLWLINYSLNIDVGVKVFPTVIWHAHEMIYGYAMAVVSGFLLTAVTNWTNRKTLAGKSLSVMFVFWLLARVSAFLSIENNLEIMFLFDSLFLFMLLTGISLPVIKSRQWSQLSIVLVILFILLSNSLFYAGQLGLVNGAERAGLYAGFYLILLLVLILARRVIPFFIEKGVDNDFVPNNFVWVDKLVLPLFLGFIILEVFDISSSASSLLAAILFVLNLVRVSNWYSHAIWSKPLLWILVIGYAFITLGFLLKSLTYISDISELIVLHLFAVGGVSLITLGMMSRVALGHTGRNVSDPPAVVFWIFVSIMLAVIFRVLFPIIFGGFYLQWVLLSQLFWIVAFTIFCISYSAMLVKPRIDGRAG